MCAWLVHGYHPYVEDAEIYLPGIEKIVNPSLFPAQCGVLPVPCTSDRCSLPHRSVGAMEPLPFDCGCVLAFGLDFFFLVVHVIGSQCFSVPRARWAGVALVAALLSSAGAGTHYTFGSISQPTESRSFAAGFFAIAGVIEKALLACGFGLCLRRLCIPLMAPSLSRWRSW